MEKLKPLTSPLELFKRLSEDFPEVIEPTNQECRRIYGEKCDLNEHAYRWFEILANTLNDEMNYAHLKIDLVKLFELICTSYTMGNKEMQQFIDVTIVENLFWNVKKDHIKIYWEKLPPVLQELYEDFHWKKAYE